MKYIIFEDFSDQSIPVLFPDRIDHGELREQVPYSTVLSAGFVNYVGGEFVCHGEAKSLGTKAATGDAKIIEAHFQQGEV